MSYQSSLLLAVTLAVSILLIPTNAWAQLVDEDGRMLERLFEQGITDPTGKQYVRVKQSVRSVWTDSNTVETCGWLSRTAEGPGVRVQFLDGDEEPAPQGYELVDFLDQSRQCVSEKPAASDSNSTTIVLGAGTSFEADQPPLLVRAAWLHKLGHDELAAAVVDRAKLEQRGQAPLPDELREWLAWRAFDAAVNAFMVRADEEASRHAERLARLYPEYTERFGQGSQLLADLKRRQTVGRFGQGATSFPADFNSLPAAQRTSWLVDQLEEVDARQWGQPGAIAWARDPRVLALIESGDAAVPVLIDVIQRDPRLTRSVHFWRDYAWQRDVQSVREAAYVAVMTIIELPVISPEFFQTREQVDSERVFKDVADELRAYWRANGHLSRGKRLVKALADPSSDSDTLEAATSALAYPESIGGRSAIVSNSPGLRLSSSSNWAGTRGSADLMKQATLEELSDPTAAEAILGAADRQMDDAPEDAESAAYFYANALVQLGDCRIAEALNLRAEITLDEPARWLWAYAAERLGEPEPLARLAVRISTGEFKDSCLQTIVFCLSRAESPAIRDTLYLLADPTHPGFALATDELLKDEATARGWFDHPYCLRILMGELTNVTETGTVWRIENDDSVTAREANGSVLYTGLPRRLCDPASRRDLAVERVCDVAAKRLTQLVFGLPTYSLLMKNPDEAIDSLRRRIDCWGPGLRVLSPAERKALKIGFSEKRFVLDVRLQAPATPQDVAAGRAVFHLDGFDDVAPVRLPATAVLKSKLDYYGIPEKERDNDRIRSFSRALVVQAERDAAGEIRYGVIDEDWIGALCDDGLLDLKPLD